MEEHAHAQPSNTQIQRPTEFKCHSHANSMHTQANTQGVGLFFTSVCTPNRVPSILNYLQTIHCKCHGWEAVCTNLCIPVNNLLQQLVTKY